MPFGQQWAIRLLKQLSIYPVLNPMPADCQTDPAGRRFFLCPDKDIHAGPCLVTDERGVLRIVGEYDSGEHKYVKES